MSLQEIVDAVQERGSRLVEIGVTDMIPAFPPSGLGLYKRLAPLRSVIDRSLLRTPAIKYAHHMSLVFQR